MQWQFLNVTLLKFFLLKNYLRIHGKPIHLYSDKYGVFQINYGKDRSKPTQFARAMKELGIKTIAAHSPKTKGRIENKNGVLQDRLVKELREQGISTIEEANLFLPIYIEKHNKRFGKTPASSFNAHWELEHNNEQSKVLDHKELVAQWERSFKKPYKPAKNHPWRGGGKKRECLEAIC